MFSLFLEVVFNIFVFVVSEDIFKSPLYYTLIFEMGQYVDIAQYVHYT